MKNAKYMALILALALAGVGCSNKSSSGGDEAVVDPGVQAPTDPLPTDPLQNNTNTVEFVPVSFSEMNAYVATHPLNYPTNYRVSVDLTNDGTNRFSGTVKIMYDDNGQTFQGVFNSGTGTNTKIQYNDFNGMKEYYHNYWFTLNAKKVFSGYFQDQYGAIVVTVDSVTGNNQGDGQGSVNRVNGSIWYKNFAYGQAPQSPYRKCWHITDGPYDCRASAVGSKNSLSINGGYRKLGTFTNLLQSAAFK